MLCALGAAVFAAAPAPGLTRPTVFAGALVVGAFWIHSGHPIDAAATGGLAVIVCAVELARPRRGLAIAAAGGVLTAVWSSLLHIQGLPLPAALAVAAALPATSAYLARRPNFAPTVLREEALLAIFALAVVVAVTPTISEGWRAALALKLTGLDDRTTGDQVMPAWTLGLTAGSVALGGVYSLWRRG